MKSPETESRESSLNESLQEGSARGHHKSALLYQARGIHRKGIPQGIRRVWQPGQQNDCCDCCYGGKETQSTKE